MSNLIVVGFDDELRADEVLLDLYRGEAGYHVNMEDAAIVIRKGDGQILIRHAHPLVDALGARGQFLGSADRNFAFESVGGGNSRRDAGNCRGIFKAYRDRGFVY